MVRSDRDGGGPELGPLKEALSELGVDLTSPDITVVLSWLEGWTAEMESRREELQSSRDEYQDLFDLSPLAYTRLDFNGVILNLNLTASVLLGKPRSLALNTPLVFYVERSERRGFLDYLRRCRHGEGESSFEGHLTGRNGHRVPVEMVTTKTVSPDQRSVLHMAIFDRTEKTKAERALVATQKRLAAAIHASGVGIFEYDVPVENGYRCDERWAAIVGFRKNEIPPAHRIQAWFRSRIHPEDRERLEKAYADFVTGRTVGYAAEARFQHQKGHWIWIKIWAAAAERDAEGRAHHVVATVMDVTEDKKHGREMETRTRQLRALAAQLSYTEERERRQIATELQDNLGQLLGLIEMKLDVLRQSGQDATLKGSLGEVADLVAEASETIRSLIAQTSPLVLRELGLVPALERLVRDVEKDYDLWISVDKECDLPRVDSDRAVAVFRAVRELLTNVAQHARTDKARLVISCERERTRLSITVEDHGVGFHIAPVFSEDIDKMHFGLFHIHERISSLGGSFELDSAPGRGTRARLLLPVEAQTT